MSFAAATTPDADRAEVRRVVSGAGSSFAAGMRILPPVRRQAIHAVYAFCRAVDDIADDDAPNDAATARLLDRWQAEIDAVYAGAPATAIGAEIARALASADLPKDEFMMILDGMRMDADAIVAPDAAVLTAYIRRVAGAVGILSMHCFGAWRGEPSRRFALDLAHGLQLVNILRDVADDARRGRLYLPADVLSRTGVPADPAIAARHPNLPLARADLGRQARAAFARAGALVGAHRRSRLLPALMMLGPYERLLTRWERDWSAPPPRRSRPGKLIDAGLAALRPAR
ncbi:putative phytoene synthase [Oceaniovalibus guishaninsula JLT2003]|uniref:Putative phytoene synthase n=1 Tax=Oceaniovalibus guishaninsula JLT2003 TaxID=1231392 RepID=K2I4K0_9RHOB|nr:squalene/phytoene synthase family protein [Oceaniovalibus guishaninsula]EKE43820.1 putative phytoene synthase [Oceaniovalibus guishaninsula JLT2003]